MERAVQCSVVVREGGRSFGSSGKKENDGVSYPISFAHGKNLYIYIKNWVFKFYTLLYYIFKKNNFDLTNYDKSSNSDI